MASISPSTPGAAGAYSAKAICKIVGFVCLAGFLIDMSVRLLPPNLGSVEWRIGIMQQVADRSIVLLIGTAATLFGLESRRLLKQLSTLSLLVGVVFLLSSLVVIRDSLSFQQQAISTISNQASQAQTQIQKAQNNPELKVNITPERVEQASKAINTQADALKQTAKTTVLKTSVASIGNLVVVGLGLISLGRFGMRLRKSK
jgi:predicted transporter